MPQRDMPTPARAAGTSIAYLVKSTCNVCRQPASCASIRTNERGDFDVCDGCLSAARAVIASHKAPKRRPHKKPCVCMDCCDFDHGQVPDPVAPSSKPTTPEAAQTRAPWLEVD